MHPFFKHTRFSFIVSGSDPYYLEHAPIGYKTLEQDIQRSKTSDGIVLNRVQNLEFVKEDRDWLVLKADQLGVDATIQIVAEKKEGFDFVIKNSGYLDLSTLVYDKNTAKCDFSETKFDEVLRNLSKEEFELDRLTDVNGEDIDPLERRTMAWKPREIFLRSELNENTYSETFVSNVTITPPATANPISDEDVFSVLDPYVVDPIGAADVLSSNVFMYNSSRDKQLTLTFDIDISVTAYSQCQLHIYRYNNGASLDYVERIQLGSSFTTSGVDVTYTGEYDIEVSQGDSLMLGMEVSSGTYTVTVNTCKITIAEDSYFAAPNAEDRFVDVITIKQAFERITEIIDSNVTFTSDFIDTYWPNLVITGGETIRHVLYDDTEPTITTTSFDDLFRFLFTISASTEGVPPPTFFLEKDGLVDVLRIESLSYVFDSTDITMDLGALDEIEYSVFTEKIYSGVKVGYNKSGSNEEVFGLQATHTVNTYKLPVNNIDNIYDATCNFRTDPNEAELCYRKQYAQFPDTDTRYDKDTFAFDCYRDSETLVYVPFPWQTHFSAVDGIYSPNTAYNYRLSPVNCLVRHSSNFMQEYTKSAYTGKSIVYQSTKGNPELVTTLTGGSARAENGDILLSNLTNPLYEPLLIEGEAQATDNLTDQLNGGYPKKNYYGTGVFKDDTGQSSEVYLFSASVGDDVKLELVKKR